MHRRGCGASVRGPRRVAFGRSIAAARQRVCRASNTRIQLRYEQTRDGRSADISIAAYQRVFRNATRTRTPSTLRREVCTTIVQRRTGPRLFPRMCRASWPAM
jgi:hypothetical protein